MSQLDICIMKSVMTLNYVCDRRMKRSQATQTNKKNACRAAITLEYADRRKDVWLVGDDIKLDFRPVLLLNFHDE